MRVYGTRRWYLFRCLCTVVKRALSPGSLIAALFGVMWTMAVAALWTGCATLLLPPSYPLYLTSFTVTTACSFYIYLGESCQWVYVFALLSAANVLDVDVHWDYGSVWMFLVLTRMCLFPHAWVAPEDVRPSSLFWGLEDDTWSWLLSFLLTVYLSPFLPCYRHLLLVFVLGGGVISRMIRMMGLRYRQQHHFARALLCRLPVAPVTHKQKEKREWFKVTSFPSAEEVHHTLQNTVDLFPNTLVSIIVEYVMYPRFPWCVEEIDWHTLLVPEHLVVVPNAWYSNVFTSTSPRDCEVYLCVRGTNGTRPTFRISVKSHSWTLTSKITHPRALDNVQCLNRIAKRDLIRWIPSSASVSSSCSSQEEPTTMSIDTDTRPRHDATTFFVFQLEGFYSRGDILYDHDLQPVHTSI